MAAGGADNGASIDPPRARRISVDSLRATAAPRVAGRRSPVDSPAILVIATVVLTVAIAAGLLAMRHDRPYPAYAIVGSGLFAIAFAVFAVGALRLVVADARRHPDDEG